MPAKFYEQDVKSHLKDKRRLSVFLDELIAKHKAGTKTIKLSYIFCNDDKLLEINQQFLNHDTLTDIITFDLSDKNDMLVGEIYISTERVSENALSYKTSYQDELHRVIFHGALHLCGFKDKNDKDRKIMREQEDDCIKNYNKNM